MKWGILYWCLLELCMHFSPDLTSFSDSVGQELTSPGVDENRQIQMVGPSELIIGTVQSWLRVRVQNGCVSTWLCLQIIQIHWLSCMKFNMINHSWGQVSPCKQCFRNKQLVPSHHSKSSISIFSKGFRYLIWRYYYLISLFSGGGDSFPSILDTWTCWRNFSQLSLETEVLRLDPVQEWWFCKDM